MYLLQGPGAATGVLINSYTYYRGQQLAAQMQQVNPEFVEQLRSQMSTEQETKEPEGEDVKRDGSDQGQK